MADVETMEIVSDQKLLPGRILAMFTDERIARVLLAGEQGKVYATALGMTD